MAVMNGMTNLVSVPMMIVAGVWFARSNFPDWIADPAAYLPLTALVDALRRIALEGAALGSIMHQIMILFAYLVVATLAAKRLFKWY
jgi:ABC-type multidrug transport system permease subunit